MAWECSECGTQVESMRRPVGCAACGMPSAIFVRIDDAPEPGSIENLREWWLRAGLDEADIQRAA